MCRSRFALALAFAALLTPTVPALAAAPSGTISCTVHDLDPVGLHFYNPYLSTVPAPHGIRTKAQMSGSCDDSGVVGANGAITDAKAKLVVRFSAGTTCASVTSTPAVDKLGVRIEWRGLTATGRSKRIAVSRAKVGSVSWDDTAEAFVFVTGPLRGAFAGSSATVKLTLNVGNLPNPTTCPPYVGLFWGADGESSVTIP